MPLVAGLSYEVIRYAAKKESSAVFKIMTLPGLWLQNITTQEPDDSAARGRDRGTERIAEARAANA